MTWQEILKRQNLDEFYPQIKEMLDGGGNVIVRLTAGVPNSSFDNGTLSIGYDLLRGTNPKTLLAQIKTLPLLNTFNVEDSSISGVPSITVSTNQDKDWNY